MGVHNIKSPKEWTVKKGGKERYVAVKECGPREFEDFRVLFMERISAFVCDGKT